MEDYADSSPACHSRDSICLIYNSRSYPRNKPTWHAEDSRWKARQIIKIQERNKIVPKRICEIGCGAGEIRLQLQNSKVGEQYDGYELSTDAFAICNSKTNEKTQFFLLDPLEIEQRYDLVFCIDVFEHVGDYLCFLNRLKTKGTHHCFNIPLDISMNAVLRGTFTKYRRKLGHLHFFIAETAISTLQEAGYESVDYFYTAPFEQGELASKGAAFDLARIPRCVLFAISPKRLSRTLGGCSLMVLTG